VGLQLHVGALLERRIREADEVALLYQQVLHHLQATAAAAQGRWSLSWYHHKGNPFLIQPGATLSGMMRQGLLLETSRVGEQANRPPPLQ